MKKIRIILGLIVIVLLCIAFITPKKNNRTKTFKKDGVMFAVEVDGESSSTFPARGKYHIDIDCENADGRWLPETWELSLENITGEVACDVTFTTILNSDVNATFAKQIENSVGDSGNGSIVNEYVSGYRYIGKDPNNYVWFNNELWRVIGSVPVCLTASCGNSTTRLIKIIRNESIGEVVYDYSANRPSLNGAWGSNKLYNLLNGCYYGKKGTSNSDYDLNNPSTLCSNYCYSSHSYTYPDVVRVARCEYGVMGISNDTNDYYSSMIQNVYWNTGSLSDEPVNLEQVYNSEKNVQTVQGKIGIMNVSDYGYAASYGRDIWEYWRKNYTATNWLFDSDQWTMNNTISAPGNVVIIDLGFIVDYPAFVESVNVRPVVYLDPTVFVVSGNGSPTNPFKIAK